MKRLLLALALPVLLAGCYTAAETEVGYSSSAYVGYRPGYVWVDGDWYWAYDHWGWSPGYYVVARPNYYYVSGAWVGPTWRRGYWAPRGNVYVRPSYPSRLHVSPHHRR